MKLVDAVDSKSTGSDTVPVRVRPWAPFKNVAISIDIAFFIRIMEALMDILYKSFHIIDLDNESLSKVEINEDFNQFLNEFVEFSNHNEKAKLYTIKNEEGIAVDCIRHIPLKTDEEAYFNELSNKIARHLIETEKLAQAKIYPMKTSVKKGSLVQALIQKSEDEFQYILAKVEHTQWYDGSDLTKKTGFSTEKKNIWKSAIFELYEINDHILFNDIKIDSDNKAKYWTLTFLELEEKRDDASNTYSAYKAIDNELKNAIKTNSQRDYVILSNEVQNTLNTPNEFDYPTYVEELMDNYTPSVDEIDKEVIKDCLLALPERKKFDSEFKIVPQSIENKRTKKYKITEGVELSIKSSSSDFSKRITSTMKDGKRVLEIICDDDDTYAAFIDE